MVQIESDMQLCYAEYYVGGSQVKAALVAAREGIGMRYRLVMEQEQQSRICDLGGELNAAREIFLCVVWGGVSLCTLSDVVEDCLGTLF